MHLCEDIAIRTQASVFGAARAFDGFLGEEWGEALAGNAKEGREHVFRFNRGQQQAIARRRRFAEYGA